jgi:hypothetical protein
MRAAILCALVAGAATAPFVPAALAQDCAQQCRSVADDLDRKVCETKCRVLTLPAGTSPTPGPIVPPAKIVEPKPLDSKVPWRPPVAIKSRD